MFKFEVGQKFEVLDDEGFGSDGYRKGDIFTVDHFDNVNGEFSSDSYGVDKSGNFTVGLNDIDKGYVRLITDDNTLQESIESQNKMNEALNEVHTKAPETMINGKENAKEFLDNYDKARAMDNKEKLTPRDLACFERVASVIGEEKAEQELAVVISCKDECNLKSNYPDVLAAFEWEETPQGDIFWHDINKGRNPYECLEVPMAAAVAINPECDKTVKTPAHEFLKAGIGHMEDRASVRDSEDGERSMKSTVNAFNAIFGTEITEEQGWHFMTLLKISRSKGGDYRKDDYEDAAAYQALAGETASVDRR